MKTTRKYERDLCAHTMRCKAIGLLSAQPYVRFESHGRSIVAIVPSDVVPTVHDAPDPFTSRMIRVQGE